MDFLRDLSESRMFHSRNAIGRYSARHMVDFLHMQICALTILRYLPVSEKWAKDYASRTLLNGGFEKWKTNSTDLGVVGWAIASGEVEFRLPHISEKLLERLSFDFSTLERWLKSVRSTQMDLSLTKRVFARLDISLKIQDEGQRAIRRLVQDWNDLSSDEAKLATTRLLQLLHLHAPESEICRKLQEVADRNNLELHNVCNPDTGSGCDIAVDADHKNKSMLSGIVSTAVGAVLGYQGVKALRKKQVKEDATAGATSAGAIAPVVGALGSVQRRVMPTTIAIPDGSTTKNKKKKPK